MAGTKGESSTTGKEVPEWVLQVDKELTNDAAPINKHRTLDQTDKNQGRCIYRLPNSFQRAVDDDYSPRKRGFSPYYHRRDSISKVENDLKPTLKDLVRRSRKKMEDYYNAVEGVVEDLKNSYDQLLDEWRNDTAAFLKLMVLNGCFLIELLYGMANPDAHYAQDNILFSIHKDRGELEHYRRDILLLENQLPLRLLLVLNETYTGDKHNGQKSLKDMIIRIFNLPATSLKFKKWKKCGHILQVVHVGLHGEGLYQLDGLVDYLIRMYKKVLKESIDSNVLPAVGPEGSGDLIVSSAIEPQGSTGLSDINVPPAIELEDLPILSDFNVPPAIELEDLPILSDFNVPPATELDKVGIRLKTSGSKCLLDVRFVNKTLYLPLIYVDSATKSMFLNIMVFEQLHNKGGNEATSYIYFMRQLIRDADDAKLLYLRGIIRTSLHSGEVAQMFRALSRGAILLNPDDLWGPYLEVGIKLKERFDKMSPEWRKELWDKYLRSPWAIVSVLAATFLLTLTTIQTVYTVLSYLAPK